MRYPASEKSGAPTGWAFRAVRFTHTDRAGLCLASLLTGFSKAHDLITSPGFRGHQGSDDLARNKTTAPNGPFVADRLHLSLVIGCLWFYLSASPGPTIPATSWSSRRGSSAPT